MVPRTQDKRTAADSGKGKVPPETEHRTSVSRGRKGRPSTFAGPKDYAIERGERYRSQFDQDEH